MMYSLVMASTTAHTSLIGQAARTRAANQARAGLTRLAGRAVGVRQHVLTLASLGCADTAGFLHSTIVGLVVTAASLLALDYKIQG